MAYPMDNWVTAPRTKIRRKRVIYEEAPYQEGVTRAAYGPSYSTATAAQKMTRQANQYYGPGRYSRKLRTYAQGRKHKKMGRYGGRKMRGRGAYAWKLDGPSIGRKCRRR